MTILSTLFQRVKKRRAYADLMKLDDHLLSDIGLSRSDLHLMQVGFGTPTRKPAGR